MIKVGIIGGTGYTGVELLRLLAQHPDVEIGVITSRGEAGKPVSDMFPSLRRAGGPSAAGAGTRASDRGRGIDLKFTEPDDKQLAACDVVFSATPNGVAMKHARTLLDAGVKLIDLAADFRLKDPAVWEKWYGMPHACPDLLSEAVYGLPEIHRERIKSARLIANPGCYPTAVQLGFLPLLEKGLVDPGFLVADCKSGVSGAGRKAEVHTLFSEASDNFKAYGVPGHRHWPEIRQGLAAMTGGEVGLTFVPHLTPMIRGIHATLYARLTDPSVDLQALYERRYAGEAFVDVLPPKSHPDTRSVRAANTCRIAVHRPQNGETVVILSVIDNLVKGAAGQAVQNMNLLLGLPEHTGLDQLPVLP